MPYNVPAWCLQSTLSGERGARIIRKVQALYLVAFHCVLATDVPGNGHSADGVLCKTPCLQTTHTVETVIL